jgi:hypothetical protein
MKISVKSKFLVCISSLPLYLGVVILAFAALTFFHTSKFRFDWGEIFKLDKETALVTEGVVKKVIVENFFVDGQHPNKIEFEFKTSDGQLFTNFTHTDVMFKVDSIIDIEYVNVKPSISRIKGFENTYYTSDVFESLIMGIIALIIILFSFYKSSKNIKLFKNSYFTMGTLIEKQRAKRKSDPKGTCKLIYQYMDAENNEQTMEIYSNNKDLLTGDKSQLIYVNDRESSIVAKIFKALANSLRSDYEKSK